MAYNMFRVDGISYKLESNHLEVCGFVDANDCRVHLDIPECVTIRGRTIPVAAIYQDAFNGSLYLEQVTIPKNVVEIQERAFAGCANLKEVRSNGQALDIKIASKAFSGCSRLTSVIMDRTVRFLGTNAFEECINLNQVSMPLTQVHNFAFKNCKSLKAIKIADNGVIHNDTVEKSGVLEISFVGNVKSISKQALDWIYNNSIVLSCNQNSNVMDLACAGFLVIAQ